MANTFKNGSVRIANDTLIVIAKSAAEEVYGVYNSSDENPYSKDNQVKLQVLDSKISVDLDIALIDNVDVRKTVKKVQENVKRELEMMTGLEVSKVNVSVFKLMI